MTVFDLLPDLSRLSPELAVQTSRSIRGELRPSLLDRLATLSIRDILSADEKSERLELETEIDRIDDYALKLDQFVFRECPPVPAQLRKPVYRVLRKTENHYVEAEAPLFFSAESLTNVHGPVMLFHLATLAEEIFLQGECISGIRRVSFKKLVTRQMQLFVCDASQGFPESAATLIESASINGSFMLNSGRMLEFFGVQISARPVLELAHFNSFVMKLLPQGIEKEIVDGVYMMRLTSNLSDEDIPEGGFSPACTLMTMMDICMLMFLTVPRPEPTKLLLSFRDMELATDPVRQLTSGVSVEFRPHLDKSRSINDGFMLLPADFRIIPLNEKWSRVHIALGTEPYYKVVTT